MNKTVKIVVLVVFIILVVLATFLYIKTRDNGKEEIYLSELLVYYDNNEYEVLVSKNTKETYLRINEDKEICFRYPRKGKSRIKIKELSEIEAKDILKGRKEILNYTYNCSLDESLQYYKFLLEDGYNVKMYCINSQYFEVFLEKDGKIKRLIIFSDSMMICDLVDGAEFPSFLDYFVAYDYNNRISDRINQFLSSSVIES